jgi:hypothetical protein
MNTSTRYLAGPLATAALAGALAAPLAAAAGEVTQVAMTKVNKGDKFEVVLDDKNSGRFVFFTTWHAIWKQTKGGSLIDGVNNTGSGVGQLTSGQGVVSGFDLNEKGGDTYKVGWTCVSYTRAGPEGKPVGHCDGGWYIVPGSGTGRFAGMIGGGTFEAYALPSGEFHVETSGTVEK